MRTLLCHVLVAAISLGSLGHAQHNASNGSISSTTTAAKDTAAARSIASSSGRKSTASTLGNGTCPSRTANYITHTLAQQCLRTDRVHANGTQASGTQTDTRDIESTRSSSDEPSAVSPPVGAGSDDGATSAASPETAGTGIESSVSTSTTSQVSAQSQSISDAMSSSQDQEESDSPLDNAKFLSFEEWKKFAMAKYPEQGRDLRERAERQRPGINNALDGFGEDGEIELDFSGFGGNADAPKQQQATNRGARDGPTGHKAPTSPTARSKDAGKTCKERTNYASFDCAATVLKTNNECKSGSSVLVENKDSYMLNTCSAGNKYFIVELCDVILIDTVVLANYEFFSSIFRHFRVSVSDTYPVKMEKWRELGTFEARNTREVQAFLIEHPQIWARYLRIEFLTHYGSEYYCPVSLLRVHGTTMLEEMRAQEEVPPIEVSAHATVEAEVEVEGPAAVPEVPGPSTANIEITKEAHQMSSGAHAESTTAASTTETSPTTSTSTSATSKTSSERSRSDVMASQSIQNSTSAIPELAVVNDVTDMMCPSPATDSSGAVSTGDSATTHVSERLNVASNDLDTASNQSSTVAASSTSSMSAANATHTFETDQNSTAITTSNVASISASSAFAQSTTEVVAASSPSIASNASASREAAPSNETSDSTSRTPSTSATASMPPPPPQPSTQESFFKSIHKRLQQLESNSTLSLQYIEEQSRILRDAFSKVEKRQIAATTSFLTNLNSTVMTELRGFRQAYDQLWQSTVLELEGQREQYQREMLALSSRLTLVADELVWQKRMGIVQSTLLLLCLGLVLFARAGNTTGYLEVPLMQQMMGKSTAAFGRSGWESPPASPSPESRSPVGLFRRKLWRSVTDPVGGGNATDGEVSGTDSRPESKDGPMTAGESVDVHVEPPTPPIEAVGRNSAEWEDEEDEDVLDPRESQSGPATPRGTREQEGSGDSYLDTG